MSNAWDIPELRADRLSDLVPARVYAGGPVEDPAHCLFIWRTYSLPTARGMTVGFYLWDDKLERLWRNPERHTDQFLTAGVAAVIEPDFSLWTDAPLAEQLWNTYRTRWLGRFWQEAGINVIPSLNWAGPESYTFCFLGIPQYAPVVACECRTPGGNDSDRRRFLAGLAEEVRQVQPAHVVIYGGQEHAFWLTPLPAGPRYTLLESWTHARDRARRREAIRQRNRHQPNLFPAGGDEWADVAAVAAPVAVGCV